MCGAKLLPATVSAYPMDCVCFNDSLKTQHCCLSYNGRYDPPPVAYPHPPPNAHSLPTHSLLISATHDISIAVKQITQNPTVLTSYLK